jgi:non-ribosomal peptide synthetase component F
MIPVEARAYSTYLLMSISPQPITISGDRRSPRGAFPWPSGSGNQQRRSSVVDLVIEAAKSAPEAIALSSGADSMTFAELVAQSTRLASYLRALGAGPDVPVGLCLERSFDFIVSALAVLVSGAAYLPLDPTCPAARLRTILDGAQAPLLISRGCLTKRAAGSGTLTVDLDADAGTIAGAIESRDSLAQPIAVMPDQLAYIIYTSGSTGEPKGVEVTHDNLLNLIFWHRNAFGIAAGDRASHLAGVGFDAAVWEIWPYLTARATVVPVDEQARTSAGRLCDWLVRERITRSVRSDDIRRTPVGPSMAGRNGPAVFAHGRRSVA